MKHLTVVTLLAASFTSLAADIPLSLGPTVPGIAISRAGSQTVVTYTGTLQAATNLTGPWTNVGGAISPHLPAAIAQSTFYRTRSSESVFATNSVVSFSLTAPFQKYFELAHAGQPDGIIPPVREKPYFEGALSMAGLELPVSLRVRGNSSLQECPFPKMKFKVAKNDRSGTPFFDAREVKLGTHCAEGGRGPIGRLREQTATFREALAYETMWLMEFTSPRARRAHVDYQDVTPTNASPLTGWQVSRDGLILDDIEVVAERINGRALSDEELEDLTDANFDPQLIADLQFFHALLGNWDYALSVDGLGLWNTDVIELANRTLVPVAGDFDLASWVTGMVRLMAPTDYHPELPDIDRQARYELEQIRQRVSAANFTTARQRFEGKRATIELQINAALIDEPGRTNAQRHVTAFYDALTAAAR